MTIKVGEVISVSGIRIGIRIFDESNLETLFHYGEMYKGISIREYIRIQRGFIDIVCLVEGEYLDESKRDGESLSYIRKVDARPIGYFSSGVFSEGIKFMPMIKDPVHLLKEDSVKAIFGKSEDGSFFIGKMLKEEIPVSLPWKKLFNSHIGIFGNTGSGKSNTLTKLYTTLFNNKRQRMHGRSEFVLLDFNGEYTSGQIAGAEAKSVLNLSTGANGGDRFWLSASEFWNLDSLSILFQATPSTQRPFLNRVIEGRNRFPRSLTNFLRSVFERSLTTPSPRAELLEILRHISNTLGDDDMDEALSKLSWHTDRAKFYDAENRIFYNTSDGKYEANIKEHTDNLETNHLDAFQQLIVRSYTQLAFDLIQGHVQFEHIQPLMKRIEASVTALRRVLEVADGDVAEAGTLLTVISLKRCNTEMKKILPLLIAKHYYNLHKSSVASPPNKTLHLIIDEAHNILSEQAARESESWKDYRLDMFEEIIKEGRKFGVYLTLSSQRPADISPTIVSQVHNFFIHRLVNERDLQLLDNTISTLDSVSRSLIPNLARGCCIVTGTAFELPMVLQVDQLTRAQKPDSDDVDLNALWQ